ERERERESERNHLFNSTSSQEEETERARTPSFILWPGEKGDGVRPPSNGFYPTEGGLPYLALSLNQFPMDFYKPYFLLFYLSGYEISVPLTLRHFK
ncbi:hypothetical protein PO909_029648, partial [Leuciscus waleckii]